MDYSKFTVEQILKEMERIRDRLEVADGIEKQGLFIELALINKELKIRRLK